MPAKRHTALAFLLAAALQPLGHAGAEPISALPPASQAKAPAAINQSTEAAFAKLVDDYFDASFRFSPNFATESGIHDYDNLMPDYSTAGLQKWEADLKGYKEKLEALDPASLSQSSRIDREMLIADINGHLLNLDSLQPLMRNPDVYSCSISECIFSLSKRSFATPEQRLQSVIAREKAIPRLLAEAKTNLSKTPKIYTEIALEQLPGIIGFFQNSVPAAFDSVSDKSLLAQFQQTNDAAIHQLKDYQQYLKTTVLPNSVADFAIGKENYRRKLLYDEMVDTPLDELLTQGYNELHRLQKQFQDVAHKIDPGKSAQEVFLALSSDHPAPDKLLESVQAILADLRKQSLAVVDIPGDDHLVVHETPPFERATTFASMDSPGAFETKANEAFYNVTLPEKNWDKKRIEEHMRFYSTRDLITTSIHEAYPGHYVQGLWSKQGPSKTRKLLGCGTYVEGWAHYCEQMMVDRYPDDLKLKLVQLHDALLRACRYIVGIRMHTDGMSMQEAERFFIEQGYQEPANAEREAKRGTADPTYLVYTLGKLQILALRDDYKKAMGDKYDLKTFNDKFLALGMAPIKLIREAMLPPDTALTH